MSPLKNNLDKIDLKLENLVELKDRLLSEINDLNYQKDELLSKLQISQRQTVPFKKINLTAHDKRLEFEKKWKSLEVHRKAIKKQYSLQCKIQTIDSRYKATSTENEKRFNTTTNPPRTDF